MRKFRSWNYFAFICLALVLIVSTLLTACSAEVTSPSASTSVTTTSTPTPTQVFELRLSHHLPPTAPAAKALEEWTKKIEANTNGRVKFTIYPSESLAKGREAFASTLGGICDVAFINLVYESSKLSLNNIVGIECVPVPTDARGAVIWNKMLEKYPQMVKEFEGVKVLSNVVCMSTSIHTKVAVRVPNDLKGLKIAAMGGSVKLLQDAGAAAVSLSAGDWYMSLEKGVIEGVMAPVGVVTDRGIQEVLKYHLDLGIGQGGNLVVINQARWNSFPADIQAKFNELTPWLNDAIIKANEQVGIEGWQKCAGSNIVKPTAEESKLWLAVFQPDSKVWIEENASKGPSQEMYDYILKLIAETK